MIYYLYNHIFKNVSVRIFSHDILFILSYFQNYLQATYLFLLFVLFAGNMLFMPHVFGDCGKIVGLAVPAYFKEMSHLVCTIAEYRLQLVKTQNCNLPRPIGAVKIVSLAVPCLH